MLLATEFLPVDLTALVASTLGMMVVLIPVLGLTVRFAAKPLLEALRAAGILGAQAPGTGLPARDLELLARRVLELEQEVAQLRGLPARSQAAVDPQAAGAGYQAEPSRVR
jgi:hypothetical protein